MNTAPNTQAPPNGLKRATFYSCDDFVAHSVVTIGVEAAGELISLIWRCYPRPENERVSEHKD